MRRLVMLMFLLSVLTYANAQHKKDKFNPDGFQADLERYVTEKACLTPQEASRFFPVYAEMFSKQRNVREKMKTLKRVKPVTDSDCKEQIMQIDSYEVEMKQIQRIYHEKFMEILPANKVFDVIKAEEDFHREAFKTMADEMRKKE